MKELSSVPRASGGEEQLAICTLRGRGRGG
jgi:hypothetical protein